MNVLVPLGTRPEIIKLAPVVAALRAAGLTTRTVVTGQQADPTLTDPFFAGLGLAPDERWVLPTEPAERMGAMTQHADAEVATSAPDVVLLLGDTNTVPVFCLAARRHGVPVIHLEAGLRSFNETSVEEVNRKVAAATASLHLAPTQMAAEFLRREGVDAERIHVVGNPVIDVLRSRGVEPRPVADRHGVLVTAHRATNVDRPDRLAELVDLVKRVHEEIDPVTFPIHPRTAQRMAASGGDDVLRAAGVDLVAPVDYDTMLGLIGSSRLVVTDSGGLQEEASWLGVPVVVMRRSTPRWEGVAAGTAVLVGLDVDRALAAARRLADPDAQERIAAVPCPYGDGHTAERVADLLRDPAILPLLELREPDFRDGGLPG
jgi:UDP-N-acetylglucosamine 2-epimerase (non-hydrolysing)